MLYRGITRKDIISRRDGEEVMKENEGRDNAPGIGRGNDCTKEEQKEVEGDERGKWQVKRVRKEKVNWLRRYHKEGKRDKERRMLSEFAEELRRGRVVKVQDRGIERSRRLRRKACNKRGKNQMEKRRSTGNDEGKDNRGQRSQEKKGKGIKDGETTEEFLIVQDDTEDEIEMLEMHRDKGEYARKKNWRDVGSPKDNMQEVREHGDMSSRGREGGGNFSSTSGIKSRGGRGSYRNRGKKRGGRGHRSRGRGCSEERREEHAPALARKYKETLKKNI